MRNYRFTIKPDHKLFDIPEPKMFCATLKTIIDDYVIHIVRDKSDDWDMEEHQLTSVKLRFGLSLVQKKDFCVNSIDKMIKVFGVTVRSEFSFFAEDLEDLEVEITFGDDGYRD